MNQIKIRYDEVRLGDLISTKLEGEKDKGVYQVRNINVTSGNVYILFFEGKVGIAGFPYNFVDKVEQTI